jgi:hypothetical protein
MVDTGYITFAPYGYGYEGPSEGVVQLMRDVSEWMDIDAGPQSGEGKMAAERLVGMRPEERADSFIEELEARYMFASAERVDRP